MSEHSDLITAMEADSAISAVTGSRIYYMRLPQGELAGPSIVLFTTGGIPEQIHPGVSDLKTLTVHLNLYSTRTQTLHDLKVAVTNYFNTLQGVVGSEYVLNANDMIEVETTYEETTKLYRSIIHLQLQMRN